nr:hypothetical protein [Mycoplasmopsis bovis]
MLIPFNKFEAELSVFLNYKNASLESNLFKELNRLKRVLGELNTDIRTKIRPMVNNEANAYFEAYETYLNYKDELAKLFGWKKFATTWQSTSKKFKEWQ